VYAKSSPPGFGDSPRRYVTAYRLEPLAHRELEKVSDAATDIKDGFKRSNFRSSAIDHVPIAAFETPPHGLVTVDV